MQLNTVKAALPGVRTGFSGSPVFDPFTGEVVALVSQAPAGGSDSGRPGSRPGGVAAARRHPDRAYAPAEELTVLHLSDLHFGGAHGFGGEGLTDGDRRRDTLIGRLHTDLGNVRSL